MRRHSGLLGNILDHVAMAVLTHQPTPRRSHELFVKAFFNPLDPLIIHVGKTQQVRRDVPGGIEAA